MNLDSLGSLNGLFELWVGKEGLDQNHSGFVRLVGDYPSHNRSYSFGSRLHRYSYRLFLFGLSFAFGGGLLLGSNTQLSRTQYGIDPRYVLL